MALILPNTIANEQDADGNKLQQNFATIQDWANQDAISADGSTAMTAPLLLPGAPTQPNQAATKAYADGVVWTQRVTANRDAATGGTVDIKLDFDVAPITGIGTITITAYVGFAAGPGSAALSAYTNAYTGPDGGGWAVGQPMRVITEAAWNATAPVTMLVPVTKAQIPDCFVRYYFSTPNLYVRTIAVIQTLPGTW